MKPDEDIGSILDVITITEEDKRVQMKRKKTNPIVVCMLAGSLLLASCGSKNVVTEQPLERTDTKESLPMEKEKKQESKSEQRKGNAEKQLIMVYMVGSNLESEEALATLDIMEMMQSDYDRDNLRVLVCTGGASYWWMDGISSEDCQVYEVTEEDLILVDTLDHDNMADRDTLTEFLDFGYTEFPADSYALVLWDHGAGAVLGYGADENHDYDMLTVPEIREALLDTDLCSSGEKFEWVGFDACLMGMLEVADAFTDCSNYLVASEEVVAGHGWNYAFLSDYSEAESKDGQTAGQYIIDSYQDYYENNFLYATEYTMSCMDLSKVSEVEENLDVLMNLASVDLKQGAYSKIARMRDATKTFGKISDTGFYDTVDLYDLARKMRRVYADESDNLLSAINNMVVYEGSNISHAGGVAIYFPYENTEYARDWLEQYEKLGFSASYVNFVKAFESTLLGEEISEWNIEELEPEETESSTEAGQYRVQLPDELLSNYARASYSIWEEDEDGTYIAWLISHDVYLSESGELSADFDGNFFFLEDSAGNCLPCTATEIEHTDDGYSKYAIPVMVMPQGQLPMQTAYIHVKVDAEHPEGVISGIYNTLNTDAGLFPDKSAVTIEEGDIISPFLFARDIVFYEDGSVAPFDTWKSSSGIAGDFEVTGEFSIAIRPPKGGEYCFLFNVTDTQGNSSFTNPIYIEK